MVLLHEWKLAPMYRVKWYIWPNFSRARAIQASKTYPFLVPLLKFDLLPIFQKWPTHLFPSPKSHTNGYSCLYNNREPFLRPKSCKSIPSPMTRPQYQNITMCPPSGEVYCTWWYLLIFGKVVLPEIWALTWKFLIWKQSELRYHLLHEQSFEQCCYQSVQRPLNQWN